GSRGRIADDRDQQYMTGLIFFMGPLGHGHLDSVRKSQESDDGSNNALWLEYERESAKILFSSEGQGSILDYAFGEPVRVKEFFVDRVTADGKPIAAIRINLQDVVRKDGSSVCRNPLSDSIDTLSL